MPFFLMLLLSSSPYGMNHQRRKRIYYHGLVVLFHLRWIMYTHDYSICHSYTVSSVSCRSPPRHYNRRCHVYPSPPTRRDITHFSPSLLVLLTATQSQFDSDLIRNLDLDLILQDVSRFTVTRRGKDAFLDLVTSSPFTTTSNSLRFMKTNIGSKKRTILSSLRPLSSSTTRPLDIEAQNNTDRATIHDNHDDDDDIYHSSILQIAQTVEQAKDEYVLVQEALVLLTQARKYTSLSSTVSSFLFFNHTTNHHQKNMDTAIIPLPPMYDIGIPTTTSSSTSQQPSSMNTFTFNDNDYDDWLYLILKQGVNTDRLTLEHILQAEQIIHMTLQTWKWATHHLSSSSSSSSETSHTHSSFPKLFSILSNIPYSILEIVYLQISSAVIIIQGEKSYWDPLGIKSYSFQLNVDKYPSLKGLKQKEKQLRLELQRIDDRKQKSSTNKIMIEKLKTIQEEILLAEQTIINNIWSIIAKYASSIHTSLNILAKVDTVFARALYALERGGVIPSIGNEGCIHIDDFIHPVLSSPWNHHHHHSHDSDKNHVSSMVVPIQLLLPRHNTTTTTVQQRGLAITGLNGGGKTLALKSFGIVATISKLGIPILVSTKSPRPVRVDFFNQIFTQIGDDQDVLQGVSTLTARLSEYARILERMEKSSKSLELPPSIQKDYTLVLLDELGTGTDPSTGGALGQAILESLVQQSHARTVVTTHSLRIKTWSLLDDRMDCAAVCVDENVNELDISLDSNRDTSPSSRSFQLKYGIVGESNGLLAATRCLPKLPSSVLGRAHSILMDGINYDEQTEALKQSALREKEITKKELQDAFLYKEKTALTYNSLDKVARTFENKLKRMELRLESIFQIIQDESKDSMFEILGKNLAEIRLMKRSVETLTNTLQDRGLMPIPDTHVLRPGEKVVILAEGPWEGEMATVLLETSQNRGDGCILVDVTCDWVDSNNFSFLNSTTQQHLFRRGELAMWHIPKDDVVPQPAVSTKSNDRLLRLLSTLQIEKKSVPGKNQPKRKIDDKRKPVSKRKK